MGEVRRGPPLLQVHRPHRRAGVGAEGEARLARRVVGGLVLAAALEAMLRGDDPARRDERGRAEDGAVLQERSDGAVRRPRRCSGDEVGAGCLARVTARRARHEREDPDDGEAVHV